jgi:hypothetical protein
LATGLVLSTCVATDDPGTGGGSETYLLLVTSQRMPLSLRSERVLTRVAAEVGVRVEVISLETDPLDSPRGEKLRAAGAFDHLPSITAFRGDSALGPALLGYRNLEGLRTGLKLLLGQRDDLPAPDRSPVSTEQDRSTAKPEFSVRLPVTPGLFFRHVPGTRILTFDHGGNAFAIDITTGLILEAPGRVDLVPSPDGRLLVTPGVDALEFYSTEYLIRRFRAPGMQPGPRIAVDPRMTDQYPSVGVIDSTETYVDSVASGHKSKSDNWLRIEPSLGV